MAKNTPAETPVVEVQEEEAHPSGLGKEALHSAEVAGWVYNDGRWVRKESLQA